MKIALFATPSFYSAFAPVALAVLGLAFTWATGWFDVQRTRISNDKTLLEAQLIFSFVLLAQLTPVSTQMSREEFRG
jgi:hypothetical protein